MGWVHFNYVIRRSKSGKTYEVCSSGCHSRGRSQEIIRVRGGFRSRKNAERWVMRYGE